MDHIDHIDQTSTNAAFAGPHGPYKSQIPPLVFSPTARAVHMIALVHMGGPYDCSAESCIFTGLVQVVHMVRLVFCAENFSEKKITSGSGRELGLGKRKGRRLLTDPKSFVY